MTKVQNSKNVTNNVFKSVFGPGTIRPPSQSQTSQQTVLSLSNSIRETLTHELSVMFGLHDESFCLGHDIITDQGQPFKCIDQMKLPISSIREPTNEDFTEQDRKFRSSHLWQLLTRWHERVDLPVLKNILANVADKLLSEYVFWAYAGQFYEGVERHLQFWIQHVFLRHTHQILSVMRGSSPLSNRMKESTFCSRDLPRLQEIASNRFGALRVSELFEIVVEWDQTKTGIQDLRLFATHPATRSYITTNFNLAIMSRLLHPGASTIDILQFYISAIRAFRMLDPRGVLLDRVARKIRRYLREREDTIKILVAGLLSDPPQDDDTPMATKLEDTHTEQKVLTDIAQELHRSANIDSNVDAGELDWNNMEWMPDPIDAAPDYMRSKNTDVIGSLTSLFESKDVFVKELQIALADRLLQDKPDFQLETRVIEHLKIRFGDAALQVCEVMMRDIRDSKRDDTRIRSLQKMNYGENVKVSHANTGQEDEPHLRTKILSRLFWPSLQDQTFKVPHPVALQQAKYEQGFEALKQSRKLTWANSIGQVEVELELDDRTVTEEVTPWQASVIYCFQDESSQHPVTRSVSVIASELEMSVPLARSACIFWTSRRVLLETAKDTFTVLESLTIDSTSNVTNNPLANPTESNDVATAIAIAAAEAAAANAAAQAAKEAEEAEREQKMAIYHQFVKSMLTNQGAMPLARIAMMLNIVVPGGFPFSTEELREFLTGMIRDGVLEMAHGGNYKVVS